MNIDHVENLERFIKKIPMNVFFKDAECRYTYATDVCDKLNVQGENWSIIGKTELEVQRIPELAKQYYEEDQTIIRTGESTYCISAFPTPERTYYYEIKKNPVRDQNGKIIGIAGVVNDITELTEARSELEKFYLTDSITGLYNHKYLDRWKNAQPNEFPITLIVADCNELKQLNDLYGHEYGDRLLQNVGLLFQQTLPDNCIAIREGGDEFLIICKKTDESAAASLIELLQERSSAYLVQEHPLSLAYGAAALQEVNSFEQAHRLADQRMYQMKKEMKASRT